MTFLKDETIKNKVFGSCSFFLSLRATGKSCSAWDLRGYIMIFKIFGCIVLIIFYGTYFIKMISQKKKGIQTDQIGKGKDGTVKCIELTMKVATYSVPVAEGISIVLNTYIFPDWMRSVGIGVGGIGVVVFIVSVLTMSDSWRAGVSETDKTKLITTGIYQISRNPAFLGFDLVYIGILLMFFNWVLFIVSIFAMIMFHLQIVNVEEDFLIGTFGEEYLTYKNKVNRYIGRR